MNNEEVIERLHTIQLNILAEFDRVCKKNNINYFLICGTCLGAIRHKGFIPWDDDIDVGMFVEDYDRFVKCSKDFRKNYFLQTTETDENFRVPIARVRANNTTLIEDDFIDCDIHHGIFMDVYPLYSYPESKIKGKILSYESILYRLLLLDRVPKNHGKISRIISGAMLKLYSKKRRAKKIAKISEKMRKNKASNKVAFLYGLDVNLKKTIVYEKDWFVPQAIVDFCGLKYPIPGKWDTYLTSKYGDYMQLPPLEKRKSYHTFWFVDFDNSYEKYKHVKYLIEE